MKRIDRAMYAFFLLALLGDVARSQVRVPVDAGGGFVTQAAGQYRVEVAGFRPVALRPIERIKSYSLSLIRWAWSLSASARADTTASAVLESVAFKLSAGLSALLVFSLLLGSSWTVFEHVGSPAP